MNNNTYFNKMENLTKKLKIIYLPFLMFSISFILLYTFFHWLFLIKLNTLSVKVDVVEFFAPFILICLLIYIWLKPRINTLKVYNSSNGTGLYLVIVIFSILAPTVFAQKYLVKATGKLTHLESINSINNFEQTKYYSLKNYFIDKKNVGILTDCNVSGKNSSQFNMNIYLVLPIFESASDTTQSNCNTWIGMEYSKTISNHLGRNEKEEKFQNFCNESETDFNNKDIQQFVYLDRIGNTNSAEFFDEAISNCPKYESIHPQFFFAINEPFENRYGNNLAWIFGSFGIGATIWLIILLLVKFDDTELRRYESKKISAIDELKNLFINLKPTHDNLITFSIIYINILIFMLMMFAGLGFISFNTQDLIHWGANFKPLTANDQWWRLLTNIFLHGGFMHILSNIVGLLMVGIFLEPLLGRNKFLISYLLTGILASCVSLWWHDNTVSVGASGAIFGLYGIFIIFLLTKISPTFNNRPLLTFTGIFIGSNLLIGISDGIDNAAHIGGLLSGIIIGIILYSSIKKQLKNKPSIIEF